MNTSTTTCTFLYFTLIINLVFLFGQSLPDNIDITGSEMGVVALPQNIHPAWNREGFVYYTKIVAPNGGAIHIVAQDAISRSQIIRSRNVLEHFLKVTNFIGIKV